MKMGAAWGLAAAIVVVGCSDFRRTVESQPSRTQQRVTVNYKGPDGFKLAVRKADDWCDERVGKSDVRLLKDDRAAGRAVFVCEPL